MEIKKRRIEVHGNGQQAPFGIGEIICRFPATYAGLIKAVRKAHYWYNPATVVVPNGVAQTGWWRVMDYGVFPDGRPVVRNCDRGYAVSQS